MRSRVHGTPENRRFSFLEKVLEDFFHGLLGDACRAILVSLPADAPPKPPGGATSSRTAAVATGAATPPPAVEAVWRRHGVANVIGPATGSPAARLAHAERGSGPPGGHTLPGP
jgi:hypothetical protein